MERKIKEEEHVEVSPLPSIHHETSIPNNIIQQTVEIKEEIKNEVINEGELVKNNTTKTSKKLKATKNSKKGGKNKKQTKSLQNYHTIFVVIEDLWKNNRLGHPAFENSIEGLKVAVKVFNVLESHINHPSIVFFLRTMNPQEVQNECPFPVFEEKDLNEKLKNASQSTLVVALRKYENVDVIEPIPFFKATQKKRLNKWLKSFKKEYNRSLQKEKLQKNREILFAIKPYQCLKSDTIEIDFEINFRKEQEKKRKLEEELSNIASKRVKIGNSIKESKYDTIFMIVEDLCSRVIDNMNTSSKLCIRMAKDIVSSVSQKLKCPKFILFHKFDDIDDDTENDIQVLHRKHITESIEQYNDSLLIVGNGPLQYVPIMQPWDFLQTTTGIKVQKLKKWVESFKHKEIGDEKIGELTVFNNIFFDITQMLSDPDLQYFEKNENIVYSVREMLSALHQKLKEPRIIIFHEFVNVPDSDDGKVQILHKKKLDENIEKYSQTSVLLVMKNHNLDNITDIDKIYFMEAFPFFQKAHGQVRLRKWLLKFTSKPQVSDVSIKVEEKIKKEEII